MKFKSIALATVLAVLVSAPAALGAGFALIEQGVSGLGNAYAGGAAAAEDATTVYYNPAGMTRLQGAHTVLGVHYIRPSSKFDKESSSVITAPAGAPGPNSGGNGGDGGVPGVVPNFYFTTPCKETAAVWGIGINVPFGLATSYKDGWVGRYHALDSEVATININPSVALKLADKLSFGVGFNLQHVSARLTNAVDFGLVAFNASGGALGTPQGQDGEVELEADDWATGFNLGFLYEFDADSRIGFAYRSKMRYTATGDADFTVPSSVTSLPLVGPGIAAQFADTDVTADIVLPDSASLSFYHALGPQWALMGDITWTNWSEFDKLAIQFDSSLPDNVTQESWKDNFRYSLGTSFKPSDPLTLRLGVAYDKTPISDKRRTPRIPGEDRLWLALGAGYKIGSMFSCDIGYAHLFVDDSKSELQLADHTSSGSLIGEYENSVDIASVQFNLFF